MIFMNPLRELKKKMTKDLIGDERVNVWKKISEISGLSLSTLFSITKIKSKEEVKRMRLGTYLALKEKLNVDMLHLIDSDN